MISENDCVDNTKAILLNPKGSKVMEEIKELLQGSTVDSMDGNQARDETLITIDQKIGEIQQNFMLIGRRELNSLVQEITQVKDGLSKVVNKEIIQTLFKYHTKQIECKSLIQEKQDIQRQYEALVSRHESSLLELEKEKQKADQLLQQNKDLSNVMMEQSTFWTQFGSHACTLLWRASSQGDSIKNILSGDHGSKFFEVTAYALESYFTALRSHKFSKTKELSAEHQFIFMLTGFLTNVTACPLGRQYFMENKDNLSVLDTTSQMLVNLSMKELGWAKLRNLFLKIFYNLSLNEKGITYVASQIQLTKALISSMSDDSCAENRLQSIRILHSIFLEPEKTKDICSIMDLIPRETLSSLIKTSGGEVKSALEELEAEYRNHGREL